eukprot:6060024-Amphidinium_carterae.1
MEAKRRFFLLKLTMLSGRSTLVAAPSDEDVRPFWTVEFVLAVCLERLGLADNAAMMDGIQLLHGSERLPADVRVEDLPGVQPPGEISEYQLVITR